MTNISQSFTYKMAAKINWHRYETKLTVIDIVETILKRSQDFRFVTTILPARRYASAGTSYVPVSVCLSVCLSDTRWSSIEIDERINVVFGMQASFDQSYTVVLGNSGIYKKIRVLPSGMFFF